MAKKVKYPKKFRQKLEKLAADRKERPGDAAHREKVERTFGVPPSEADMNDEISPELLAAIQADPEGSLAQHVLERQLRDEPSVFRTCAHEFLGVNSVRLIAVSVEQEADNRLRMYTHHYLEEPLSAFDYAPVSAPWKRADPRPPRKPGPS